MSPARILQTSRLLFLAVVILLISSCDHERDIARIRIDPGFSSYVSAFTSGIVSSRSALKVVLAEPYPQAEAGAPVGEKVFSFDPEIEGQAVWADEQTIEFRPHKRLPSGETFIGSFQLGELMQVESKYEEMEFGFVVITQSLFVSFDGLRAPNYRDLSKQELFGTVRTSDEADPNELQSCLKANQDGQNLVIEWAETDDSKAFTYTIKDVARGDDASTVELEWNGEAIGAKTDDDLEVRIPPLDEFTMMQVNTVREPGLHFSVYFSDPVDRKQDLTGLVRLESGKPLRLVTRGNEVKAYPLEELSSEETIVIESSIVNSRGVQLDESYSRDVEFNLAEPAVELLGEGVIIPSSEGIEFPFRAINLKAVNVRVIKVFEQNVHQFMQVNQLSGHSQLTRVGRLVYDGTLDLISTDPIDYGVWNNFSINLSNIVSPEPGAIYRVLISFERYQSLYPCADEDSDTKPFKREKLNFDDGDSYYSDNDWYDVDYNWEDRDNPCKPSYYAYYDRGIAANLFASDLGIVAKESGGNNYNVVVTDLKTTDPISGVTIEAYNYQNFKIGDGETNSDGVVQFATEGKPYLLVAKQGKQRGYLRVDNGSAISMSLFEVGGSKTKQGIKAHLFAERGVWRPGDTIFLGCMLEDKQEVLPKNHPVVVELYDPLGKLQLKQVSTKGEEGLYAFKLPTDREAPTGLWMARATVGGSQFSKSLKVETVKPNRLRINLEFGDVITPNQSLSTTLNTSWLYGSPGANLKARVEMTAREMKTSFKGFESYRFDDRTTYFDPTEPIVVEAKTDGSGNANIYVPWERPEDAPGMLKLKFGTKVFEPGGDFSQDYLNVPYAPYSSFVGLKIDGGTNWMNALDSEKDHAIALAAVSAKGEPLDKLVNVRLYKMRWNWWWETTRDGDSRYISRSSLDLVDKGSTRVSDGKGLYELSFDDRVWGRYMLIVEDPSSGHSASHEFFVDYSGWWSDLESGSDAASILTLETDKPEYTVGEKVEVTLPSGGIGRIYVTVEKGDQILDQFWVEAASGSTRFNFETTEEMAPNVYVNAVLLQPHGQDENSLPIRMFGLAPIRVNNPETHLEPLIAAPAEMQPEKTFEVTVSEKNGRKMAYTLAVVDEGLLGLTRFKTKDPWNTFYAKEALSIRSWDMYNYVMNAETGKMASLLAIGGDENLTMEEDPNAERFKPVVQFLGPFYLGSGDENDHEITIPNYLGAVRIMVVGGYQGAYGKAETEVPVKQPLMVLSTLPRVLGPSERIRVPVNVITMDDRIKNVDVKITSHELLEPVGSVSRSVSFSKQGEKVVFFDFDVARKLGVAKFKVEINSGKETAYEEVEIEVRPPNPDLLRVESQTLAAGENWSYDYTALGIQGTNRAMLQVSRIPDLDLEKHLEYLIRYPHGCIEQTTSSVFPQLFLSKLIDLRNDQEDNIEKNVAAGLKRLRQFQQTSGGFSYWPGSSDYISNWGTNYAGHFMLEAKNNGYDLPDGLLQQWLKYQSTTAASWVRGSEQWGRNGNDFSQAYRLYTLALAGSPDIGAMNRLRLDSALSDGGAWRLATAYAVIGQDDVARELSNRSTTVEPYREQSYSFGSHLRDMAMILETLTYLKDTERGGTLVRELASGLNTGWHSTQTRAYGMMAIAKFTGGDASSEFDFTYEANGETEKMDSDLPMHQISIEDEHLMSGKVGVQNRSDQVLFVSLVQRGIPVEANDGATQQDLRMRVSYQDLKGNSVDVTSLDQGTDFKAVVTVTHPGVRSSYKEVALTQIFPSGWQVINTRVGDEEGDAGVTPFTYQDIRDDRVYTYFDLNKGESKTFEIALNATFAGKFYKPAIFCAPMYDESIQALEPGSWVEVTGNDNSQALAE